jgi:hypothetical protein
MMSRLERALFLGLTAMTFLLEDAATVSKRASSWRSFAPLPVQRDLLMRAAGKFGTNLRFLFSAVLVLRDV